MVFIQENKKYLTWGLYLIVIIALLAFLQPYIADKTPSRLVQATVTGILVGGVYSLVALGIVIINKSSGVFNFAHGMMMLMGGLIFFSFFTVGDIAEWAAFGLAFVTVAIVYVQQYSIRSPDPKALGIAVATIVVLTILMTIGGIQYRWLHALVGGFLGSIFIGFLIERFTIRPLIGQPLFTAVLMTLAVDRLLRGITQLIWGSVEVTLPIYQNISKLGIDVPIRIDGRETFLDGQVIIRTELLFAFILSLIGFGGFILFFRYTNIGLAMRATAEDQQLAQSVGLRVRVILAIAWGIAALLAALAGILQGGATTLSFNLPLLALRAFPAVLLGGLESIEGALVGGIIIGLVEQWGVLLFPNQVGTELAPYLVLMAVLVVRPEGLFGQKIIERI